MNIEQYIFSLSGNEIIESNGLINTINEANKFLYNLKINYPVTEADLQ